MLPEYGGKDVDDSCLIDAREMHFHIIPDISAAIRCLSSGALTVSDRYDQHAGI